MVVRTALTAEQIAQMASTGVNPAASAAATAPSVVTPAAPAAGGATADAAAAAVAAAAVAAAAATAATAATAAVATPATEAAAAAAAAAPPAANTDVVTFLQTQVATKDAALLSANVELTGLKSKIADNEASITGLKAIAASSITNMRVALGGSKTDLSALTATELLAQHTSVKAEFETKFVAGGVAAVDATSNNKQANVDPSVSEAELKRLNRFLA